MSKVISPLQTQQNFSLSDTGSPDSSMTMSGISLSGDLRDFDKSPRGRAISTACDKISTKRGTGKAKKMFSKLKGNSFKFRSLKRTSSTKETPKEVLEEPTVQQVEEKVQVRPRSKSDSTEMGHVRKHKDYIFKKIVSKDRTHGFKFQRDQEFYNPEINIEQAERIESMLARNRCQVDKLRKMLWESSGKWPLRQRALTWQLVLRTLPAEASLRGEHIRTVQEKYFKYVHDYYEPAVFLSLASQRKQQQRAAQYAEGKLTAAQVLEMNTKKDATEQELKDEATIALLRQIQVDITRTHPDGYFALFSKRKTRCILERVLFVWSYLNSEEGYFQGLNELTTPLFAALLCEQISFCDKAAERIEMLTQEQLDYMEARLFDTLTRIMNHLEVCFIISNISFFSFPFQQPLIHSSKLHLHSDQMLVLFESVLNWVNRLFNTSSLSLSFIHSLLFHSFPC